MNGPLSVLENEVKIRLSTHAISQALVRLFRGAVV